MFLLVLSHTIKIITNNTHGLKLYWMIIARNLHSQWYDIWRLSALMTKDAIWRIQLGLQKTAHRRR